MKYIILELIPTSLDPNKGDIIQLSALKIQDLKILEFQLEMDSLFLYLLM